MSIDLTNITPGKSLAISVSGTDYVRRSAEAGVEVGILAPTKLQNDVAAGRETVTGALKRVSSDTLEAIEAALKKANSAASLDTYAPGNGWRDSAGTIFTLIA
ncbi:hypothetical protein [Sphingomonas glacialis]|uniref:Uncharacterized protein n=1 Tax=Sphingomonas glacialis TaxID=658225 RepID=A0A502FRM9_9SPHN|nr:hypothetical protein [Sphingomonas glacialis]TPG52059.1 hypothetical protein EAH76_15175 [Sphingomonas glacialis]